MIGDAVYVCIVCSFTDSMESNSMNVDSPMSTVGSMPQQMSPADIKPDISHLVTTGGFTNPSSSQASAQHPFPSSTQGFTPPPQPQGAYNTPSSTQQGYLNMMGRGQMAPGPLQSPTLHSPSSMHSPGGALSPQQSMTSPQLTPLQSPTSTMGSPSMSGMVQGMGGASAMQGMSTKHICAICGDRASGKHYGVYRFVRQVYHVNSAYTVLATRCKVVIFTVMAFLALILLLTQTDMK